MDDSFWRDVLRCSELSLMMRGAATVIEAGYDHHPPLLVRDRGKLRPESNSISLYACDGNTSIE